MNKWSIWKRMNVIIIGGVFLILLVNLLIWVNTDRNARQIDSVYGSNVSLNALMDNLDLVQDSMTDYLENKTVESMEEFYSNAADFETLVEGLSDTVSNNESQLMEKNIKNLSESYLELTYDTVDAKRSRNVEGYKDKYEEAKRTYDYIRTCIYSLNSTQFRNNSEKYDAMVDSFHYSEVISMIVVLVVIVVILVVLTFIIRRMTALEESREAIRIDAMLQDKAHEMDSKIKDAQLMYLQAQIHPHFLFNSLNAGAQLAMLENASKTYDYIQNLAEFFRYNLKKRDEVTLAQEVEQIDHYIYVLNVRFSGDIHFVKNVDESLLDLKMPGMILQPIVENSVNYGVRNIDREKIIELEISSMDDQVCICIRDNGVGISQEAIDKVMAGQTSQSDDPGSNGVGLSNVISRLQLYFNTDEVATIQSLGPNVGTEVMLYLKNNVDN